MIVRICHKICNKTNKRLKGQYNDNNKRIQENGSENTRTTLSIHDDG